MKRADIVRKAVDGLMEMGLSKRDAVKRILDLYHTRLTYAPAGTAIEMAIMDDIGILYEILIEDKRETEEK